MLLKVQLARVRASKAQDRAVTALLTKCKASVEQCKVMANKFPTVASMEQGQVPVPLQELYHKIANTFHARLQLLETVTMSEPAEDAQASRADAHKVWG